ncbi:MAG: hypothetical protein LBI79_07215, partial [Nitrososphaerota archaeon]|nr:hypothetical protein [Nitrososphaerota archaeon]
WGDGTVVVPATCTENGLMFFYCTKCGVFLGEGVIDVLGHNWDKGVITIPVTHETDGLMTFTCSHCGVTYTELIPKPSDNTLSVSGVEIEFEAVGGTVTLKPTQTQMTVILSIPGKDVIFDLRGHTFVELYVGAGWFKNVDKTIIIKTADGEATVNTKSLWNNSGKTILITVDNGKLNFKNI